MQAKDLSPLWRYEPVSSDIRGRNQKEMGELRLKKFNAIDIVIALAIIAFVVGFLYNRTAADIRQIIAADTPIYVTFVVESVREFSFDAVEAGDVFFRQHERVPLGNVVEVTRGPAYDIIVLADGSAAYAPMLDRYNMYITIAGIGSVTDTGYFLNGTQQMSVGGGITIQSNRFLTTVRVHEVTG